MFYCVTDGLNRMVEVEMFFYFDITFLPTSDYLNFSVNKDIFWKQLHQITACIQTKSFYDDLIFHSVKCFVTY